MGYCTDRWTELSKQLGTVSHLHPDGGRGEELGTLHADGHRHESIEQLLVALMHTRPEHRLEDVDTQRVTRLAAVELDQCL